MSPYGLMLMPRGQDTVRFDDFELDIRAYELRRNGRPVNSSGAPWTFSSSSLSVAVSS